jgi:hypothetical protein
VTASLEEFMGRLLSMEQTEAGAIEPICFVAHASRARAPPARPTSIRGSSVTSG